MIISESFSSHNLKILRILHNKKNQVAQDSLVTLNMVIIQNESFLS